MDSQGRYEEAEAMHRETLGRSEKTLGLEHPGRLTIMNNLALVLNNQGKYEEAEAMHKQTLAQREKVLGPEHPDTLTSAYCLAHLLATRDCYEESLTLYDRVIAAYSITLGKHHPTTRACRKHRSEALASQKQSQIVHSDKVSRLSRGLAKLGITGSK
jgi:tetratricopeptide (TPR) repeat protein